MTKKKKSKHIKQKKHKKQVRHAKQTVQKSRSGHAKQAPQKSQTKRTGGTKPAEQVKQAKRTGGTKPAEQVKQAKRTGETKPAEQVKQTKQTGQKSQTKQTPQSQKVKQTKQSKSEWKEVLYNCPYLLGIVFTSLLVMFWSDEIGFKAIAREAQTVMAQVSGIHSSVGTVVLKPDSTSQSEKSESITVNPDDMEKNGTDDIELEENAGKRKVDIDDNEDGNKLKNDTIGLESEENTEKTEENIKGVTHFKIYEPQIIDSRYYSDAGKIALTTEYPYTKQNISYFNDAAFLGDSRTLGISDYAGLDEADFFCDSGMMIFKLLEEEITDQKTGDKVDLTQVLQEKQYGKIYIMLGMNELGYGNTEMYLEEYRKVVNQIREWQPQAIIYVMANLHVSREKNNMETEFNNININDKNAASAQLANGTDIFYLDANPLFTDNDGYLNPDLTFDGVHLYAQHYDKWREFLLEHAVEPLPEDNREPSEANE